MDFYSGDPLPTPPPGVGGSSAGGAGASGSFGVAGLAGVGGVGVAGVGGIGVAGAGGRACNNQTAVSFPGLMGNNSGAIPDEGGCFRIDHPNNGFNTVGCSNWAPATRTLRCNGVDVPSCTTPTASNYPGPQNGNDYFEIGPGTPSFTKGSIFWYTQ